MNRKESRSSANEDAFRSGDGTDKKGEDAKHRGCPTKTKSRPISSTGTSSQSSSPGTSSTETLAGAAAASSNVTSDACFESRGANAREDLQQGLEQPLRKESADKSTQKDDRQQHRSAWDLPRKCIQWQEETTMDAGPWSQSKGGKSTSLPALYHPLDSTQGAYPTDAQQRTSIQHNQNERRTEQNYNSAQASQSHGCIGDGRPKKDCRLPQNPSYTREPKPDSRKQQRQSPRKRRPSRDAQRGASNMLLPSLQNRNNITDQFQNTDAFPTAQFSEQNPQQHNEGARPKENIRQRKYSNSRKEESRLATDSSSQNASRMNRPDVVGNRSLPSGGGARQKENFGRVQHLNTQQEENRRASDSSSQKASRMNSPDVSDSEISAVGTLLSTITMTGERSRNPPDATSRTSQHGYRGGAGPNERYRHSPDRNVRAMRQQPRNALEGPRNIRQDLHSASNRQVFPINFNARPRRLPPLSSPEMASLVTGVQGERMNTSTSNPHLATYSSSGPSIPPLEQRSCAVHPVHPQHVSEIQQCAPPAPQGPGHTRPQEGVFQGLFPAWHYTGPSFQHTGPQFQHSGPQFQHTAPQFQHTASQFQHTASQFQYTAPQFQYTASQFQYTAPQFQYTAPQFQYTAPQFQYTAPQFQYTAPQFQHTGPQFQHTAPLECIPQHYGWGQLSGASAPPYQSTVPPLGLVAQQSQQAMLPQDFAAATAGHELSHWNHFPPYTFFSVPEFTATMLRATWPRLQGRADEFGDSSQMDTEAQFLSPEAQAQAHTRNAIGGMHISVGQHFISPPCVPMTRIMMASYSPNENPFTMDTIYLHVTLRDMTRYHVPATTNARVTSAFGNELDDMRVELTHSVRCTRFGAPFVICAEISPNGAPNTHEYYEYDERVMIMIKYPSSLETLSLVALRQSIQFHDWSSLRLMLDRVEGTVVYVLSDLVRQDGTAADVRTLLAAGTSANAAAPHSTAPIMVSASVGVTEALLDYGAYVNMEYDVDSDYGRTPLLRAARCGDNPMFQLILSRNGDGHQADHRGYTPLMFAVMYGISDENIALLLATGVDVNARNRLGETALFLAMHRKGRRATLRLLCSRGATVNASNNSGMTPLMRAAESMSIRSIRLLIRRGADVNLVDRFNANALMFAITSRNRVSSLCDIASLLGNTGTVNTVSENERTPLMLSAERKKTCQRVAMRLIELGADTNMVTGSGRERRTALSIAFHRFRRDTFRQGAMAYLLYLLYIVDEMPILSNFRPLIHFLMMKSSCHAVRYAIEKGAVPLEVSIQELQYLLGSPFMHSCHRETISPLFLAVYIGSEILVKYFIHIRFYTASDLHTLTNDPCLDRKIRHLRHSRCLYMVRRALSSRGGGLEAMALASVSHNIGGGPERLRNIEGLRLPWLINMYLMYLLPTHLLDKETEEGEPDLSEKPVFTSGDYHMLRMSTIHPALTCHCQAQPCRRAAAICNEVDAIEATRQHSESGPLKWPALNKFSVRFDSDTESEATNDSAGDATDRSSDEEAAVGYENTEIQSSGVRERNSAAPAQIEGVAARVPDANGAGDHRPIAQESTADRQEREDQLSSDESGNCSDVESAED